MAELAKIIDGKLCLSSAAMVEIFAVSRPTLGNWASSGCPKARNGWWPLAEVIKWKGLTGAGMGQDGLTDSQRRTKADADLKEQQAQKIARDNLIADGEYISKAELVETLTPYFAELKRSLVAFSRTVSMEVAPHVDPTTARRISSDFDSLAREFLRRIAQGTEYTGRAKRRKR